MAFGSSLSMFFLVIFVCLTIISISGMIVITNSIFTVKDNNVYISDAQLIIGKITLGFYWALCIIALVLSVYIYGFKY